MSGVAYRDDVFAYHAERLFFACGACAAEEPLPTTKESFAAFFERWVFRRYPAMPRLTCPECSQRLRVRLTCAALNCCAPGGRCAETVTLREQADGALPPDWHRDGHGRLYCAACSRRLRLGRFLGEWVAERKERRAPRGAAPSAPPASAPVVGAPHRADEDRGGTDGGVEGGAPPTASAKGEEAGR